MYLPLKTTKEVKHQMTMNELREAPCLIFSIFASEILISLAFRLLFSCENKLSSVLASEI